MPTPETIDADTYTVAEGAQEASSIVRARILHLLEIFPFLSSSMIHMGIGTSTSTALWRPVLVALVAEGLLEQKEVAARTPLDRMQSYTIYHLKKNKYTYDQNPDETPEVPAV